MNFQNLLSADKVEFLIGLSITVTLIFAAFILQAYVQHIIRQRKRNKSIFPLPEISDEGKGLAAVFGTTAIIWGTVIMLLFSSCTTVRGLDTQGTIIKAEPDRVFVLFEDAMGKPGTYSGNWFHIPGAGMIDITKSYVKVHIIQIEP